MFKKDTIDLKGGGGILVTLARVLGDLTMI